MKLNYLLSAALVLFAISGIAPSCAATFRIPLLVHPPTIDGRIGAAEWAGAMRIDGFAWNNTLERRGVSGYVGATADHLFLAIRSQLPAEGELVADVQRDTENLVFDDSAEIWIDPTPGAESGARYQLLLNSLGHHFYKMHAYGNVHEDPAWQGDWDVASLAHDGVWDCELAVPLASLAPGRSAIAGSWGINLTRNWKSEWAWSSLGGSAYSPTDQFIFTAEPAPVVGLEDRGDPFAGSVNSVIVLRNPSPQPITVKVNLNLDRDVMPALNNSDTIRLAAGETREYPLQVKDDATRKYTLSAHVVSEDGQAEIFSRSVSWRAAGPWRWTTKKKVIPPVDFQFAYYPYLNRMRIHADVSNLPHGAVLKDLTADIRKTNGASIKTVHFTNLKAGKQDLQIDLPPLEGSCEVALKAVGAGIPDHEVVRPFERTRYVWEHTALGRSRKVYPPFTPLRVQGPTVSTVLRDHRMNAAGLWDQVSARGVDLLAAPMRWDVTAQGAKQETRLGELHVTQDGEDRAEAHAILNAGPLRGRVECGWDYDGTMRVDLTLLPGDPRPLESLTLVISLKDQEATYFHAMGDGIRNTLSGRVPAGDGIVWSAKSVQASDMPHNFCTYVYVGTPVRGLCWFAENDRGWGWDPSTPNVEMVRKGDVLELRVHLVNQPLVVSQPRTLTFGLLAAPVKPRLTSDWRYEYRRDNYSLLGTDINWLALGDCGSVYPAGKDLFLWQMIKKGNEEHLTPAEIQSVVDRGKPYFAPYGDDVVQTFISHARFNTTSRFGTKMIFYYNRASYQAADEFETFKDEWDLSDYRTVDKGNSRGEIKIVPSESYIDHALYWYARSFDVGGNRGVYWDNWFFAPSYNTTMTGAYQKPDGSVVPSTGIWGLRELEKRTFQMMNEKGMLPVTMPHMTSTAILPMLSFAALQYDWEWRYSEGDVQYRFPRDYILMVSNGELAGTWPVLLGDHGKLADDPWTARTFAAVAMVHELDCPYAGWSKTGQSQIRLFKPVDDILREPGVEVYRYWDDRPQPVIADSPDLPTIVYSVKGKHAVFAVVSYAEKDVPATITIDPKTLGFPAGCRVVDAETGEELQVKDNTVVFNLKKHDVRVCMVSGS